MSPPPSDVADMSFVDVLAADNGASGAHASGSTQSWLSRISFSFVSRIVYAAKRNGKLDVEDTSPAPSKYECRATSEALAHNMNYTDKDGNPAQRSMFKALLMHYKGDQAIGAPATLLQYVFQFCTPFVVS
ncbi:hypothetical protein KIPB_013129, partial [Kipferlia bialata]|eukprot:g13129.t1